VFKNGFNGFVSVSLTFVGTILVEIGFGSFYLFSIGSVSRGFTFWLANLDFGSSGFC
jgi:hypothetical protein